MARFELQKIINAKPGATLVPESRSSSSFYAWHQDSFAIFPDQATIVGVDAVNTSKVLVENVCNSQATTTKFGTRSAMVHAILLMGNSDSLLAGDANGAVVQYSRDPSSGLWTVKHDYGNLEIDSVRSAARLGHVAVFGGYNTSSIRLLDTRDLRKLGAPYQTAVQYVYSLQMCRASKGQTLLSVTGGLTKLSDSRSDVLDISDLVRRQRIELHDFSQECVGSSPGTESESETKQVPSPHACNCKHGKWSQQVMAKLEHCVDQVVTKVMSAILEASAKST